MRTELVVILDRSGSMQSRKDDHEGGLRSFVADQRALAGECRLTFVRFDDHDPFEVVYDATLLHEVDEAKLTLIPRGGTPLLEAVGRTIAHVRDRHATGLRPDATIVMIITDGEENRSGPDWTKARIQALVKECEGLGTWKILYLGANVDEFAEAAALGANLNAALGFAPTKAGTANAYRVTSANTVSARTAGARGMSMEAAFAALDYTDEQRAQAKAPDTTTNAPGPVFKVWDKNKPRKGPQ